MIGSTPGLIRAQLPGLVRPRRAGDGAPGSTQSGDIHYFDPGVDPGPGWLKLPAAAMRQWIRVLHPSYPSTSLLTIKYAGGRYYCIGKGAISFATSTDISPVSADWKYIVWPFSPTSDYPRDFAYGNGVWVAVGGDSGNAIASSVDGVNFTARTSVFGSDSISCVIFVPSLGLFVAGGGMGKIATSPDGVNWTLKTTGIGNRRIISFAVGNGKIVALCFDQAYVSIDTNTWGSVGQTTFGLDSSAYSIAYGNGVWMPGLSDKKTPYIRE